jgi:hypothetical protein
MSYTVQSNFVPSFFNVYDSDNVATQSACPQPCNLEDDQFLNNIDPFVTCLYQATTSDQTSPKVSIRTRDVCSMLIGQHFDSSVSKPGSLDYGTSTTDISDSIGLAKGSPYELFFSSQVSPQNKS